MSICMRLRRADAQEREAWPYRDHVIYYSVAMDGWIWHDTQCHTHTPPHTHMQYLYASQKLIRQQLVMITFHFHSHTDIDLRKATKAFSNKFSCGASVTGDDEIVIQGDVTDDLFDFIPETWPDVSSVGQGLLGITFVTVLVHTSDGHIARHDISLYILYIAMAIFENCAWRYVTIFLAEGQNWLNCW